MRFRKPSNIGREKWYVAVDMPNGDVHYLHLDGTVCSLVDADKLLFKTKALAEKAISNYNKTIHIGGE